MERTDGLGRYLQNFQVEKDDTRAKGPYKHLLFVKKETDNIRHKEVFKYFALIWW